MESYILTVFTILIFTYTIKVLNHYPTNQTVCENPASTFVYKIHIYCNLMLSFNHIGSIRISVIFVFKYILLQSYNQIGGLSKTVLFIVLLKYGAYSDPNCKQLVEYVNIFDQTGSLCINLLIHISLSSIINVDKCGILKSPLP